MPSRFGAGKQFYDNAVYTSIESEPLLFTLIQYPCLPDDSGQPPRVRFVKPDLVLAKQKSPRPGPGASSNGRIQLTG
jgi:hypothetical protein